MAAGDRTAAGREEDYKTQSITRRGDTHSESAQKTNANAPRALAGSKGAVGAYGGTPAPLAGGAGDCLVALELETAAFCARYGTPRALELLLLGLCRALLVLGVLAGAGGERGHGR